MSKAYLQEGEIQLVTINSTVAAGGLYQQQGIVGVAQSAGVSGDAINLMLCGVHLVAKTTGTAWSQGQKLYLDTSTGFASTLDYKGPFLGYAFAAAGSADATGEVLLARAGGDPVPPYHTSVTFTAGVGAVSIHGSQLPKVAATNRVIVHQVSAANASTAYGVAYTLAIVDATSITITMKKADTTTETGDASSRLVTIFWS